MNLRPIAKALVPVLAGAVASVLIWVGTDADAIDLDALEAAIAGVLLGGGVWAVRNGRRVPPA